MILFGLGAAVLTALVFIAIRFGAAEQKRREAEVARKTAEEVIGYVQQVDADLRDLDRGALIERLRKLEGQ